MSTTPSFQAVYENGVLRPLEPLALPEHQVVSVTILPAGTAEAIAPDNLPPQQDALEAWLDEASRLPPEGPKDGLSSREHVLAGTPIQPIDEAAEAARQADVWAELSARLAEIPDFPDPDGATDRDHDRILYRERDR